VVVNFGGFYSAVPQKTAFSKAPTAISMATATASCQFAAAVITVAVTMLQQYYNRHDYLSTNMS
jgi:hypothetical protein